MAQKALDLLKNDDGFFVMLEGALIDVAEHGNDAASAVVSKKRKRKVEEEETNLTLAYVII